MSSGAAAVQFTFDIYFCNISFIIIISSVQQCQKWSLDVEYFQWKLYDEPVLIIAFHCHPLEYSVLFSLLCLSLLSTLFTCSFSNKTRYDERYQCDATIIINNYMFQASICPKHVELFIIIVASSWYLSSFSYTMHGHTYIKTRYEFIFLISH